MKYKYELHLHSCIVSKCSEFTPEEIVKFYKEKNYDGIFVTEHFLNGNSTIDKTLPYEKQIEEYEKGYLTIKRLGDIVGLKTFFGVEYSYKGTDFLIYGLNAKWYKSHPEVITMKCREALAYMRLNGGFVVQAHPFRQASYIDHIRLFPDVSDGIEIDNANRTDFENKMANGYACSYNLLKICGSDIHSPHQKKLSVFVTNIPIENEKHFINMVINKKFKISHINLKKKLPK